jgi:hypothetical protein
MAAGLDQSPCFALAALGAFVGSGDLCATLNS